MQVFHRAPERIFIPVDEFNVFPAGLLVGEPTLQTGRDWLR